MEGFALPDKIILLFDYYSPESCLLHESFLQTGCDCIAVSLEENDFLPRNVFSVYDLLSRECKIEDENRGKPRFFNEIAVPDNWSIQAGDSISGKITCMQEEKGRIWYLQGGRKFLVEAVDWYDRKGNVRFRDHYNRYGENCARTVYNTKGQALCKTRFSESGKEMLTENIITGDMILYVDGGVKLFRSKLDLLVYWFGRRGLDRNRIIYNSLSTPFFISNRLEGTEKKDILFWQESVGTEIPGNMRMILNGASGRTERIMVQKRTAYEKLLELGADRKKLHKLGPIYRFQKKNGHEPEALICTNSERIEHCEELVRALPQVHFHIAAITTMSPRLMELENYENVTLYPGAEKEMQEALFQKCDYYFDINHGAEIISAVYQAFLHNQLIFAFQETAHNQEYVTEEQVYPVDAFERMVSDIREALEDGKAMRRRLEKQRKHAMAESRKAYTDLI
ncbi:MAG: accessory Sec system glycosylation chaperone GtfB [Lachnospiraceae bacterium]|uniref:UDP-N-acetylglucosamine--peptide N-acetylglucosaminyltransferase stabilizing protein GtfB n=1 Tax=Acetatifactor muris TaxID=879566 RepID=A0A2K4ZEQ0_9FIRM|nr:accessory Sec system glycosylation chaperone GtfB [Acetatifactor muris]MCI8287454.1 accessory Sec system glycosylation chaperone GtfB [Lachnospiraceae bacterium]MCR2048538.1 accessory Sec system glycosylation chaperone GtfB [Acetatifactor muris]SOY28930.1 Glycosyltransferase-stabilizing protein Gtf2 [Acetatifactor muris]